MRDDAIPSMSDRLLEVGIKYADDLYGYSARELRRQTGFTENHIRLLKGALQEIGLQGLTD
jgi:uncharacterized protein YwqG